MLAPLRLLLWLAFWLGVIAGSLWVSVRLHAQMPLLRHALKDAIGLAVSAQIQGELTVGAVERVDLHDLVLRDVQLWSPEERRIVIAHKLSLELDTAALARWQLRISRGVIEGGELSLRDGPDGAPDLVWAVQPVEADSERDLHPYLRRLLDQLELQGPIMVDGIELRNMTLTGQIAGLDGIVAEHLEVDAAITVDDEFEFRIDDGSATLVRPFPFSARIEQLHGTISSRATDIVSLDAAARRTGEHGDEQAQTSVWLGVREGRPADDPLELRVTVDASPVHTSTLGQLGYTWAESLDSLIVGSLLIQGPLSDLSLSARVMSDGGPVAVRGSVGDAGATMAVSSEGLSLPEVLPDAPPLKVRGDVTLKMAPTPADPDEQAAPTQLHARVEPTLFEELHIPGFELDGELLPDGGLRVTGLKARQRGAQLTGSGQIHADGSARMQLRALIPDIGADPNLRRLVPNARGRAEADLRLVVPAQIERGLDFQGTLTLGELRYGSFGVQRLRLTGRVRGEPRRPVLDLQVEADGLRSGEQALGNARVALKGGPGTYKLSGRFTDRGGNPDRVGRRARRRRPRGEGEPRRRAKTETETETEAPGTASGRRRQRQRRELRVEATIHADRKGLTLSTDALQVVVGTGTWRGLMEGMRATWDGAVSIDKLMLGSSGQRLDAHGELSATGQAKLSASMTNFDLSVLYSLLGEGFPFSAGQATTAVEISGPIAHPGFTASGLLSHGELVTASDVNANYFVAYAGGQLDVDGELSLGDAGGMLLRGSATGDAAAPTLAAALDAAAYDLELSFERLSLSLVPQLAEQEIAGAASGTLRVTGPRTAPSVTGELQLDALQLPGADILRLDGKLQYAADRLETSFDISDDRGPVGALSLTAAVPLSSLLAGDTSAGSIDPLAGPWSLRGRTFARQPLLLPAPLSFELPLPATLATAFALERNDGKTTGLANLRFRATEDTSGSPCRAEVRPELVITATVDGATTGLEVAINTLGQAPLNVASGRGDIHLPFDEWIDERQLTPPGNLNLVTGIVVPDLEALPYLCAEGRGKLRAQLRLTDLLSPAPRVALDLHTTVSPRAVALDATGRRGIRSCDDDPAQLDATLEVDSRHAMLQGSMSGCGGAKSTVSAQMPVNWPSDAALPAVATDAEMVADLRFQNAQLRPLLARIPGIESGAGFADGSLRVHGPPGELQYDGELQLRDAELLVSATGQRLAGVQAELHFDRDQAQLVELHADADRGSFDMAGRWSFEHSVPRHAKMVLQTDNFPVRSEGVTVAWLTGSAALEADIGPDQSRTAVKIHQLSAHLPGDVGGNIQPLSAHPDIEMATEGGIELRPRPYLMEFQIDARSGVQVSRSDLDVTLASELGVSYADDEMRVGGYTEIVRGDFIALGKPFEINQGSIHFQGGRTIDPELQIQATHEVAASGDSVSMTVQGRLSEPDIRFASESCPGEAGAIALLVSGKCPEAGGEAGGQSATAFGGGLLGGLMSSSFGPSGPRVGVQARDGSTTTVRAGFETDPPAFLQSFVKKIYIEGGIPVGSSGGDSAEAQQAQQQSRTSLDVLMELYFPHHIVGSGRVGPDTWGLDVIWEP